MRPVGCGESFKIGIDTVFASDVLRVSCEGMSAFKFSPDDPPQRTGTVPLHDARRRQCEEVMHDGPRFAWVDTEHPASALHPLAFNC